ncbi:MAG: PDDEXK nuclease domain-containing protein, partial [Lentisphaerae bacterium]|nr:PDDEXK nuclease domain-containing protein [Lentisphaerota bacterium]
MSAINTAYSPRGSLWHRWDLHVHTPSSFDYDDRSITDQQVYVPIEDGAKVIDRLSDDLRDAFLEMQGLSARNLLFMRAFAETYPEKEIVKQLVEQLPWGHVVHLIQLVKAPEARLWYAKAAIAVGWSRSILDPQIASQAHQHQEKAVNNFALTLPPADSDMAAQIFKDPYMFDFIGTADPRREREVEQALVDHVQKFLLELGAGFAFVGRQVHL